MKTKVPSIPLHRVKSSQIDSIGHDPATNTIAVRFHSGGLYHYHDQTAEDFNKLKNSESIGKHFGQHLKTKKFTKIDEK